MKKTMLTCDTLDRFEKFINPETLTAEQVQEVEHLAYCANMGAESKESAWARFCELVKHFLNLDIIDTEKHPNIRKAIADHEAETLDKFNQEIETKTAADILASWYLKQYTTPKTFEAIKNTAPEEKPAADILAKMKAKKAREEAKNTAKRLEALALAESCKLPESVNISVEFTRSRTWGSIPHATITAEQRRTFGTASGYGYDKESAAIASAMNQNPEVISGSATATAAAIGGIMVEPMEKAGYKKEYTAAVIASSGLLGLIIPPSGTMLMYAIVADVSVLEMFTGGIIPGIIMGLSLMVVEYFRAKKNGYGTSELDIAEFHTQSKAKIVIQSFLALLSPVIILGGIYSGKFTATEAAGVSVLYGFIIGYFVFKQLNIKKAYEACVKTGISTSMILFLIGAAAVFGWMLTMQQIPNQIVAAISGITSSPAVVLLLVNLALFVAGALLDNVAAITLLTPVLVPLISAYGIDKTFFGIIMIINLSIGQITPPIGMNLFVSSSICEVRLEKVIRQVLPFLAVLIVDLFLFTYIPGIVTVLPNALLH